MSSTGKGIKPLKRGRAGSNALCARKRVGCANDPRGTAFGLFDELAFGPTNFGEALTVSGLKSLLNAASYANRMRGSSVERRKRSLLGKALKVLSRERTWLKGHQGVREGSKASRHMVSVRTQRDPGRLFAREWWIFANGLR